MERPPRLLSIAGSDSGGGAGIQADLKTFCAFGAFGMTAVTAVTAQNTLGVISVHPVPAAIVGDQIDAVLDDIGVDAIKIGMLGSAETARCVAERLEARPPTPVVLDPVIAAKSGDRLIDDDGIAVLRERLLRFATVLTPNLPEAEILVQQPIESEGARVDAARRLVEMGASSVVIKGGHPIEDARASQSSGCSDQPKVRDLLFDGTRVHRFERERIDTKSDHGTGCTLSAAIAACLGQGMLLVDAVERAGEYLHSAIRQAFALGRGHGPVNHLYKRRS